VSPTHGRLTGRQSPCPYSVLCSRLFVSVRMFDGRTDGRTDTRGGLFGGQTHTVREFFDGQTMVKLTRELTKSLMESFNSLANSSTDRQLVNSLAISYDGQTIGQLTGEFVRRTDNWSTHWRIRTTDRQLVNSHWRICMTDRQFVNSLANSYDGQTIGQLTGEFV
jgi:hypothetical protein